MMNESKTLEKEILPDRIVNAAGLHSPVPLLRLKKELASMSSEETLRIDCTDFDMRDDISSWCDRMGHTYLGEKQSDHSLSFFIVK